MYVVSLIRELYIYQVTLDRELECLKPNLEPDYLKYKICLFYKTRTFDPNDLFPHHMSVC